MKQQKTFHRCESCDGLLSTNRKFCDERCRQMEECKKSKPKYQAKVATLFQRMIRAEDAANADPVRLAVVEGVLTDVPRKVGQCVCVTCGHKMPWTVPKESPVQMQTGHFLAGRLPCILFNEDNVAPQCSTCNKHGNGMPQEYRRWMEAVRGTEAIDRLEALKRKSVSLHRDELVDLRIDYGERLRVAVAKMTCYHR